MSDRTGAVGMVGVGAMGSAMAARMLLAGHRVVVHDARPTAAESVLAQGALWADSPARLAEQCRIVLSSLPGPAEAESVHTELLSGARRGDTHVGLSTVSVECARRVFDLCRSRRVHYLDAPVSGGPMGVTEGSLSVLASGDPVALEKADPVLRSFSGRIFDLGPEPGTGTLAKLVNNAIFLCSGMVHQEAVVLAAKAGMDPATLDEVLAASSAALYLGLARPTLSRRWEGPGFSVALAEKDIALALDTARSLGVPMPVTDAAHRHYARAVEWGLGSRVFFAVLEAVEKAAGTETPAREP